MKYKNYIVKIDLIKLTETYFSNLTAFNFVGVPKYQTVLQLNTLSPAHTSAIS